MPAELSKSATLIQFPRRKLDMARRRYQMPDVERRESKRPYWRVRFRQDMLVAKG